MLELYFSEKKGGHYGHIVNKNEWGIIIENMISSKSCNTNKFEYVSLYNTVFYWFLGTPLNNLSLVKIPW